MTVVDLEPVTRPHVGAVLREQPVEELVGVDRVAGPEPHEPHHPTRGLDPLEDALRVHPGAHDGEAGAHVVEDRGEDPRSIGEHPARDRLVERRTADEHLLLRREQLLRQLRIPAHRPSDAQPGQSVGLRHRRHADRARRQRRDHRPRFGMREIAIGLVDEQHRAGALRDLHECVQRLEVEHRAGRIVRAGDRDELRDAGLHARGDAFDVEAPAIVVREVDDVEVGADRARCLEVGRVVGAHHHHVIARFEGRGGRREQRSRRAGRHQHVVETQVVAAGRDRLPQRRITQMVAVTEQEIVEPATRAEGQIEPEIGEAPIGNRALREVVGDRVVPELLGRLDLDGHPPVSHGE